MADISGIYRVLYHKYFPQEYWRIIHCSVSPVSPFMFDTILIPDISCDIMFLLVLDSVRIFCVMPYLYSNMTY